MGSLRTHECAQCGHSWICVNCGLDAALARAEKAEREIEDAFAAAVLRGVPRADRTLSRLVSDMGHDLLSSRAAVRDANDVMTSLRDGRDRARADAERLAAALRLVRACRGSWCDDCRVALDRALAAHEEHNQGANAPATKET